ncbi:MAG: ATPase [Phycisphaerales bacterium]|nr:ATPase [Phycisphaerales bacterium]MCB9862255.1 ATPase [Phycisphaerales bacterium]
MINNNTWFEKLLARSDRLFVLTFVGLIAIGTILLWLPISGTHGSIGLLNALFTSTSAVCVTGLVTLDTAGDFTIFGQLVILALIQLGGLGIMTFAALATQLFMGRMSLRSQQSIGDTFYQGFAATRMRRDLGRIVLVTLITEMIGAAFLYRAFADPSLECATPLFHAIFHAISAFCNAGFALQSDSLIPFATNPIMMPTIMALIILGGLGHGVMLESLSRFWRSVRRRKQKTLKWSLNTRVVVVSSIALIVIGTVFLAPLHGITSSHGVIRTCVNALFQSVTCRTAGFNSIDLTTLPMTAVLIMCVLMFIGGSPGSCAGGVKTSTIVTWFAQLYAWLRGRKDVTMLGRRLAPSLVAKAAVIIGLGVLWINTGTMLLTLFEQGNKDMSIESLFFEQVSAFGTVGLSLGVTAELTVASKLWIILSMFVGRVGPLTFAVVIYESDATAVRYPEEAIMVG